MTADEYFKHWNGRSVWKHLEWPKHQDRFDALARNLSGETFADVGCGFGHSTAELEKRCPGDWTGIDFSALGIDRAREFFPERKFLHFEDFEAAAAGAGPFDGTVCSEVLEHVEDDHKAAQALLKMTAKIVVISTPNKKVNDPGHIRIYTANRLREIFEGAKRIQVWEEGPFFFAGIVP